MPTPIGAALGTSRARVASSGFSKKVGTRQDSTMAKVGDEVSPGRFVIAVGKRRSDRKRFYVVKCVVCGLESRVNRDRLDAQCGACFRKQFYETGRL